MPGTNDTKRELRRALRPLRQQAALDPRRSAAIVDRLAEMPQLVQARTVMLFEPVAGEPDLRPLAHRLRERGVTVVVPAPEPGAAEPDRADSLDVAVVPGVGFTREGHRLGQGGGWYDRVLAGIRPDCTVIGVCFDEQLVAALPVEPHDVPVHRIVTPTATYPAGDAHLPVEQG